ncbi:hypothetical protein HAX54_013365 [Datura stramonium]|uniref:Uncharacterized protein n=1 Tax=Datura stramonium TaxID=4076 RepID=A0ABS8TM65_DATST|nr:hypothetical protein [Datura stramonium]
MSVVKAVRRESDAVRVLAAAMVVHRFTSGCLRSLGGLFSGVVFTGEGEKLREVWRRSKREGRGVCPVRFRRRSGTMVRIYSEKEKMTRETEERLGHGLWSGSRADYMGRIRL